MLFSSSCVNSDLFPRSLALSPALGFKAEVTVCGLVKGIWLALWIQSVLQNRNLKNESSTRGRDAETDGLVPNAAWCFNLTGDEELECGEMFTSKEPWPTLWYIFIITERKAEHWRSGKRHSNVSVNSTETGHNAATLPHTTRRGNTPHCYTRIINTVGEYTWMFCTKDASGHYGYNYPSTPHTHTHTGIHPPTPAA